MKNLTYSLGLLALATMLFTATANAQLTVTVVAPAKPIEVATTFQPFSFVVDKTPHSYGNDITNITTFVMREQVTTNLSTGDLFTNQIAKPVRTPTPFFYVNGVLNETQKVSVRFFGDDIAQIQVAMASAPRTNLLAGITDPAATARLQAILNRAQITAR